MAQSRPPPVRTHAIATSTSPPPTSPRTHSEKRHHTRRKSGKDYSSTSDKKSSRPPTVSRKTAPQYITKGGSGYSSGSQRSSHRDRDYDGGRDSGESFPQFCMTCEKQFLPANTTTILYCSEACRIHDQAPTHTIRTSTYSSSPPLTPYSRQFSYPSNTTYDDGPDIIPRFSPTQSRPRSYFNSDPYPQHAQSYHVSSTTANTYSTSPTQIQGSYNPTNSSSSVALDSLRSLAIALPRTTPSASSRRNDPESPPKSRGSSITRTGSGVWDYIPFTSSSKAPAQTPNQTPGNSYSNGGPGAGYTASQSYGAGYGNGNGGGRSKEDLYSYGKSQGYTQPQAAYGSTGGIGMGMDRPLPPRTGPSGYGHRPRSIDLVTPFSGH